MTLKLTQLEASQDHDDQMLGAVPDVSSLDFSVRRNAIDKQIEQVAFDGKKGSLIIVRADGHVLEISGFPTLSAFGEGRPGPKGLPGARGRNGRIGRDGSTGERGCDGEVGNRGLIGDPGNEGEDGPRGATGLPGYPGNTGARGDEGPVGPTGMEGPVGNEGSSCVAGAVGPTGPAPYERVMTSSKEPHDPLVFGWLFPTSPEDPNPIPLPSTPDVSASIPSINLVGIRAPGEAANIWGTETYLMSNVRNGVGPFTYRWSLHGIDDVTIRDTSNPVCFIKFSKAIGPGVTWTKQGTVKLIVTDEGRQHRPSSTATATITVTATNPEVPRVNNCIVFGSKVLTPAGYVAVEHLREGMLVSTVSGQPKEFRSWSAHSLNSKPATAAIRNIRYGVESYYFIINGQGFTQEHPVLVYDTVWHYVPAREVTRKHKLYSPKGIVSVSEIRRVDSNVNTVDIDVDPHDCYFVGNVLVHNSDIVSRGEKENESNQDSN